MNKIYLITLLGLVMACDQTNNTIPSSGEFYGYPPNSEVLEYPDSPGLTKVTVMFADKIEMQGDYVNETRNGTWTEYHGNDLVKSITTYINGQQHGIRVEMDDRGNLVKKAFYHNGKFDGELAFYGNGRVTEKRFYVNGVLNGALSKYYSSGKIMEESTYQNGKINGKAKWYDQDGNVTIEYDYLDGQLVQEDE
jgi:antitoxin component YwqK of YwqJK toxin-antitoxin module